jgi:hypothetical protein
MSSRAEKMFQGVLLHTLNGSLLVLARAISEWLHVYLAGVNLSAIHVYLQSGHMDIQLRTSSNNGTRRVLELEY